MPVVRSAAQPARRPSSPAVDKAAIVLKAIAAAGTSMGFSALADVVPFARSSLHDVCSGLMRNGLIEKTEDGRYQIGMLVVELSRQRVASMNVVQAFQQSISRSEPLRETVVLAVASGADVTYVSFVDSGRPLAVRYEIGMRLPAAFTATGKAILATRPVNDVLRSYDVSIANPNRDRPDKERATLLDEMAQTRARGYSIDDEETAAGMICIGVPVFSSAGEVAADAVAMSLVKHRDLALTPELVGHLMDIARDMTAQLGGSTRWYRGAGVQES